MRITIDIDGDQASVPQAQPGPEGGGGSGAPEARSTAPPADLAARAAAIGAIDGGSAPVDQVSQAGPGVNVSNQDVSVAQPAGGDHDGGGAPGGGEAVVAEEGVEPEGAD